MYAIRSYYGITASARKPVTSRVRRFMATMPLQAPWPSSTRERNSHHSYFCTRPRDRITSYNVCYTKLLRASPQLLGEAVYGLPELHRQAVKQARLVANPGCYPTAVALGFLPLVEQGLVELDYLIADTKSGVSGAGRKASVAQLMGETGESFKAYAIPGHRHQPEISYNFV